MLPDAKTARILGLEKQALDALFERMKELAFLSRSHRMEVLVYARLLMGQFRDAYAQRRRPKPLTERMLQLLDKKMTELAEADSEPQEAGRCGVCASPLETTGIGTFCSRCLDAMLPFYEWLESENSSFSRTGRGV